tara:strand:- start:509 stop:964 length:456 start_codon:yes stop_codon:yes gene_type:complete
LNYANSTTRRSAQRYIRSSCRKVSGRGIFYNDAYPNSWNYRFISSGERNLFSSQSKPRINKTIIIINSLGLFALVLGVFGQLIQLINTLDYLSSFEGTTPRDFADGLKTTMLPTLFGAFIFLFTRLSTILLHWIKPFQVKEDKPVFSKESN